MPLSAVSAPATAADEPPADPWRGLKMGMASYSFRGLSLDACIKGIQRLDLRYVSIKDAHLKLTSSTEERKLVAQKFRDAGITPLSCGVIYFTNNEAQVRNIFVSMPATSAYPPSSAELEVPDALDHCPTSSSGNTRHSHRDPQPRPNR